MLNGLLFAIIIFILLALGAVIYYSYKNYKLIRELYITKIDLAEKELMQDVYDVGLSELSKTKSGNQLLVLLTKQSSVLENDWRNEQYRITARRLAHEYKAKTKNKHDMKNQNQPEYVYYRKS